MDTLSHALLGAATGQLVLGRKADNRVLLVAAGIALVPDVDVAIGALLGDAAALTFHRGITHSLLFALVAGLGLGWLLARVSRGTDIRAAHWRLMCWAILFGHLALDAFTSYGIQLLLPFSDHSFAIASISVIDPLFTLPLLVTVVALCCRRRGRLGLAWAGVVLSTTYLLATGVNKVVVTGRFEQAMAEQNLEMRQLFVKPTMFNNLLWRGIVDTGEGYGVAFYSLMDESPPADFVFFPRNDELLAPHRDAPLVQDLLKVSANYYQVEEVDGELFFHDLRYGKSFEWLKDDRPHVFSYRLIVESGEVVDLEVHGLAVDRERERRTFQALVSRALGES